MTTHSKADLEAADAFIDDPEQRRFYLLGIQHERNKTEELLARLRRRLASKLVSRAAFRIIDEEIAKHQAPKSEEAE